MKPFLSVFGHLILEVAVATSLPLIPKPHKGVEQGVMNVKVGLLFLCHLRNNPSLVPS